MFVLGKRIKHSNDISSGWKVFEGDDGEIFERNWLYWTGKRIIYANLILIIFNILIFIGARMLYRYLPRNAGLRRITLHKCGFIFFFQSSFLVVIQDSWIRNAYNIFKFTYTAVAKSGDKMYLLICECADLLKDLSSAAYLIPALRARLCGYTGLYKPIKSF